MAYYHGTGRILPQRPLSSSYQHKLPGSSEESCYSADRGSPEEASSSWNYSGEAETEDSVTVNVDLVGLYHGTNQPTDCLHYSAPLSQPRFLPPRNQLQHPRNRNWTNKQTNFHAGSCPAGGRRKQLIHELSSSPPLPPSALPCYSIDRSLEEQLPADLSNFNNYPSTGHILCLSAPDYRHERISHSCPSSPRQVHLTYQSPSSPEQRPGEAFLPPGTQHHHHHYHHRHHQTPWHPPDTEQPGYLEARMGEDFTQNCSKDVGGGKPAPTTHHPFVNSYQELEPQDFHQFTNHFTATNFQQTPPTLSYPKGVSDPNSDNYQENINYSLQPPAEKDTRKGHHRPLSLSRSADPGSTEQMVRQASDKKLFLSPLAAEDASASPRLPQRSRSLRHNPNRAPGRRSQSPNKTSARKPPQTSAQGQISALDRQYRERTGSMPDSAQLEPQRVTTSRRGGSFRTKREDARCRTPKRYDEWPRAEVNVHTQRFLQLPDADEYARLRSFTIDEKGCVINRGDSFRLRSNTRGSASDNQSSSGGSNSAFASPHSGSPEFIPSGVATAGSTVDSDDSDLLSTEAFQKPQKSYQITVVGSGGCGKTSLINQFMTSEHRNPFSSELDNPAEDIVSIVIEGNESELKFTEVNVEKDTMWMSAPATAYLVLYSVDSKVSFREAANILYDLRERSQTANAHLLLAANKIDLARTRVVSTQEGKTTAKSYGCDYYEFSVALNHGVDELLIGILAEINKGPNKCQEELGDGFRLSIRRFSQRKQRHTSKKRGSLGKGEKSPRGSLKENNSTGKGSSEHQHKEKKSKSASSASGKGSGQKPSGFTNFMNKLFKKRGSTCSSEDLHH